MDHWSILLAYSAYPVILAALAPRTRFSLHKEFRDGEIRLYLHKEFRAAEIGFSLHKEWRRCVRKWRFSEEETAFAGSIFSGALILYSERIDERFFQINLENALRPVENQGDDATGNDNFQSRKQRLQGRKNSTIVWFKAFHMVRLRGDIKTNKLFQSKKAVSCRFALCSVEFEGKRQRQVLGKESQKEQQKKTEKARAGEVVSEDSQKA